MTSIRLSDLNNTFFDIYFMKLASIINSDQVVLELSSSEHEGVISELVDHMAELQGFEPELSVELKSSFIEREKEFTTGIGNGVAIPHAFSDEIQDPVVVLGKSSHGLDFGSLDDQPVRLVVLFVSPKGEYHKHLNVLAAIGKTFRSTGVIDGVLEAGSEEEVVELLRMKK